MKEIKLTRKELYDIVWSEPLTAIAKKIETSDYALRKTCKDFNIPLPKSGHWMKIQFGKPVMIEPLDKNYEGRDDVSLTQQTKAPAPIRTSTSNENSLPGILTETPVEERMVTIKEELSPLEELKMEIENDQNVSLKVPDRLVKPDKLIESLKNELKDQKGYAPDGNRLKTRDQLKVLVNRETLERALRFMDTFIKAIRARGHDIQIQYEKTCVVIYNEKTLVSRLE